jgi:hypothetical protein
MAMLATISKSSISGDAGHYMVKLANWRGWPLSGDDSGHYMIKLASWRGWPLSGNVGHFIVKFATVPGEASHYQAMLATIW